MDQLRLPVSILDNATDETSIATLIFALLLEGRQRIRKLAGWLLVPYFVWIAFATALTISVWMRNPGVL